MILVFTLDDQNGVSLAGRRQSSDRIVAQRICALAGNETLWIKKKSYAFFENSNITCKCNEFISIDELSVAAPNDICFLEEIPSNEILAQAERIYVFRWNRRYPSLMHERLNLDNLNKSIISEFSGYSHDKITLEVYTK